MAIRSGSQSAARRSSPEGGTLIFQAKSPRVRSTDSPNSAGPPERLASMSVTPNTRWPSVGWLAVDPVQTIGVAVAWRLDPVR